MGSSIKPKRKNQKWKSGCEQEMKRKMATVCGTTYVRMYKYLRDNTDVNYFYGNQT